MKLIDNWRKTVWRAWSIRLSAVATAVWAYLLASPETMLAVLNQIPADMRGWFPSFIPVLLFGLVTVSRLVRQEKLK